jgi:toxin-antitoxin system PIN domain toxin
LRTSSSGLFLLDANVLIALCWPTHGSHKVVEEWFGRRGAKGWATCPFTQAAFVRIVSNPTFSRDALAPPKAVRLLQDNLQHPGHRFWPANIPVADAMRGTMTRLSGHQQITDAYLIALGVQNRGRLATLDRGILQLGGAGSVEIVGG